MHRNSALLFEKYAVNFFKENMRVLEIGPDEIPSAYEKIVKNNKILWETLDISRRYNSPTYFADSEYVFPVPDNTFDVVLSCQVIEHVRKIWVWIKELCRVCKHGGIIITINPVNWPFHEAPYDCWRIYPDGMKALYEEAGAEVILNKRESLDMASLKKRLFYFLNARRLLRDPSSYINELFFGIKIWQHYMAEDLITIARK